MIVSNNGTGTVTIGSRATTAGGPYTTVASNVTETTYLDAGWTDDGPYRERFAQWATSPAHPWFAANTANRLWAHLFGRGLVTRLGARGPDPDRDRHVDVGHEGQQLVEPGAVDHRAGAVELEDDRRERLRRRLLVQHLPHEAEVHVAQPARANR